MHENKLFHNGFEKFLLVFFVVGLYDFFTSLILHKQFLFKPIIYMLPFIFILIRYLIKKYLIKKRHSY